MMKVYRAPLRGDFGCSWPLLLLILTSGVATSLAWTMNTPDSAWSHVRATCSGLLSQGFSRAMKAWDATGLCLVSTPA